MRSNRRLQRVLALLAAGACFAITPWVIASEQGQAAADQVTEASYRYFLGDNQGAPGILYTHSGDSRGVGAPQHDLARDNIEAHFASYGLTVTLEPVVYSSTTYYNVVGTKLGTLDPDIEYVVGAHYDSVSNPGADDDASGVALVLECARILSQYDSDYTIRFVAFTREEQGLYGSNAYVNAHVGDDIRGMVQADMVAYDPGTDNALIYGHDVPALALKNALRAAITEYGVYQSVALTSTDGGWNGQSDHAPFDAAGYEACLLIEGEVWSNPYYHTASDSVENTSNINYEYATAMTKSVVGYLTDAAGVLIDVDALTFDYPSGQPQFVSPGGGTTMRVEVAALGAAVPDPGTGVLHYSVGAGWQSTPMTVVSANVYDAVFPASTCGDTVYYYVSAETTLGEVFTNPRTAPAAVHSAVSAYGETVLFSDNFEADQFWTVSGDATAGVWERGVPLGGGDRGDPATDYDGSGQCYVTDPDYGDTDVDGGYTYLTSPMLDLSDGDAAIHFALWYTNNFGGDPNNDLFKIWVANDGGLNWTLVETIGPASSSGWTEKWFTVGDFVSPTAQVRVRFEASDLNSGSVVEAGIDAFSIRVLECAPDCAGDLDGDGDIDLSDLAQLLANYGLTGGASPADGDMDGDGDVDLSDLAALLAVYGTSC